MREKPAETYFAKGDYIRQNLEDDVTQLLHEIGIPAHIKGYQYLRDAITISVEEKEMLVSVTKVLYPTLPRRQAHPQAVWNEPSAMRRGGVEPRTAWR